MPDLSAAAQTAEHWEAWAVHWGLDVAWALALAVAGWVTAQWVERGVDAALGRVKNCDLMLRGFFSNLARWGVLVFTVLAVFERLGVQTTSIVTMVGAAGLAVGLALQGTLTSLAAGIMLLLFRPFRVGDEISSGTVTGTVKVVALFHTELVTPENIQVILPNSTLWGTALKNDTFYPARRLSMVVPLPYAADAEAAIARIRGLVGAESRVLSDPAPVIHISRFNATDKVTEIEVLLWCATKDQPAVQSQMMAAFWRDLIKPALG